MIAAEFDGVKRILNGRYNLFTDQQDVIRWYEELKDYDFAIVKEAINDWIVNDGWKPEVVNIVERCKDVIRWHRQIAAANAENPNTKTVACPYCHDTGLIIKTYPNGVETGQPCERCRAGQINYPWFFLSADEKRDYNAKEIKAGRSVPNYHIAPDEFRKAYLYDKK